MVICEKCFCDTEVISLIQSKAQKGDCAVCGSREVYVYDTDKYDDLGFLLDDLLNIYTPATLLPKEYPREKVYNLKDE